MVDWFKGQQLITPQAAVFIDDTALAGQSAGGSGDLCIIGSSLGGQPLTPLYFVTPQDATRALIGGDGLRAVLRAFSVAPQYVGAPRVIFIRANAATQSSFTLKDTGGTNNSLVLTSRDYGTQTNLIAVQVNAGSTTGRKVTIKQATGSFTWVQDNITRQGLSVANATGGAHTITASVGPVTTAAATTTVTTSPVVANASPQSISVGSSTLFTNVAPATQLLVGRPGSATAEVVTVTAMLDGTHVSGIFTKAHAVGDPIYIYTGDTGFAVQSLNAGTDVPAEDFILPFSQFATLQSLVDAINAKVGLYTATLLSPNGADPSTQLDPISGVTLATGPGTAFTMDLYALQLAINNVGQPFVTAAPATGATLPPLIEAAGVWHYLTGAVDGTTPPSATDWNNALNVATTVDCSVIVPATGNATVHAAFQLHVAQESTMNERRERIMLCGGVAGETSAQALTRVAALHDIRTGLVYPGIIDVDATKPALGAIVLDPWLVAAQLGGMFCGGPIADSLTNKYLRAAGVETQITNAVRDQLQLNGIIPIQLIQDKGVKCVHSISTWTADSNYRRNELSVMRASDFLAKMVRESLDPLVGRVNNPAIQLLARQTVSSVLGSMEDNGVIVGDRNSPAYKNIQVASYGDVLRVSFQAAIAVPANYIEITAALFAYSGTLANTL